MAEAIPEQMKALRLVNFKENYHLVKDVPVPTPGDRQVLVRINAAGFCHTNHMVYDGAFDTKLPHTGSHEPTGTVAALGSGASPRWSIGDRVGVYLFSNPCGSCSGCKWWSKAHNGNLNARYCDNRTMVGIVEADGGFAEYMIASVDGVVKIPDKVPFEREHFSRHCSSLKLTNLLEAAPLMCAGATVWNGVLEAGIEKGQTLAIVGIGALGLLGIQFAKSLGYRVVAISSRDLGPTLESAEIPKDLWPDLTVSSKSEGSIQQILDFTDGTGLDAAVVCTDNVSENDWIVHQLRPRGTSVVLGLPGEGFRFDAINLIFREIVVKGALHASVETMERMFEVVAKHNIRSQLTVVPIDEAENLPERSAAHDYKGKLVVSVA